MYNGKPTEITDKNAFPLLAMADHYLLPGLIKQLTDYLSSRLSKDNAIPMIKCSIQNRCDEITRRCLLIIARNFSTIFNSSGSISPTNTIYSTFNFFPPSIFIALLQHRYLSVKSEYKLFLLAQSYISSHSESSSSTSLSSPLSNEVLTPEMKNSIFENIRFKFMSYTELENVILSQIVPSFFLLEALMSLHKDCSIHHSPSLTSSSVFSSNNPRLQKRMLYGLTFEREFDYDKKGLLYWIGSQDGTWRNPAIYHGVTVSASSKESGDLRNLTALEPSEVWTQDVPASWMQVDIGESRAIVPSLYTLRHGGNYKADSLRTWDFQGSTDGRDWVVLQRHTNDDHLNDRFATFSWEIKGGKEQRKAFRYFRVLQTGHNSSNHNFLVLSGLELYGDYFEYKPGRIDEINDSLPKS